MTSLERGGESGVVRPRQGRYSVGRRGQKEQEQEQEQQKEGPAA